MVFLTIGICCLFAVCFYLIGKLFSMKKDIIVLQTAMVSAIKTNGELLKLHTALHESNNITATTLEKVAKQQIANIKDFQNFKHEVSDAFVIITDYFESVGKGGLNITSPAKADKLKPN